MIELFQCERLRARITQATCETNRKSGRIFACDGCDGLDKSAPKKEAAVATGSKCKVNKCNKYVSKAGYCWGHAKENGIDPKTGKSLAAKSAEILDTVDAGKINIQLPPATPPKLGLILPPPTAQPAEVMQSDMASEIEALFAAKRAEWLEDLAGATTLRSRAKLFLSMCESIETLGY